MCSLLLKKITYTSKIVVNKTHLVTQNNESLCYTDSNQQFNSNSILLEVFFYMTLFFISYIYFYFLFYFKYFHFFFDVFLKNISFSII